MKTLTDRCKVLWQSDGTAAPGLTKNTVIFLGASGSWHTTAAVTDWIYVDTRGASRLLVQYRSKILNGGGITGNATNNLSVMAVLDHFHEYDGDLVPEVIAAAPPSSGTVAYASTAALRWLSPEQTFNDNAPVYRICYMASHGQAFQQGLTLFRGTGAVSNNSWVGWGFEVGEVPSLNKGSSNAPFSTTPAQDMTRLSVDGVDGVWLSMSMFYSGTGGTDANLRIKGILRAVLMG